MIVGVVYYERIVIIIIPTEICIFSNIYIMRMAYFIEYLYLQCNGFEQSVDVT